jgi:hypothetical protein
MVLLSYIDTRYKKNIQRVLSLEVDLEMIIKLYISIHKYSFVVLLS